MRSPLASRTWPQSDDESRRRGGVQGGEVFIVVEII